MKIGIVSLGCCKNLTDTQHMIGILMKSNQEITYDLQQAEAIIINTCGFIAPAKEEAINTILEMAEYKKVKCRKLIVMGCLVQRYKEDLMASLPEVDSFITISDYPNLGVMLTEVLGERILNEYGKTPQVLTDYPWMGYLKIGEGCDNRCTYCAIPLIRGGLNSYPMEDIISKAKIMAENGVKELNLIAQDTTRYGLDLYGELKLLDLLKKLNEIEGFVWIRILYMYPDEITDELIEGMAKLDKVLPYFDIPIQHGSDKMLKLMNRRGTQETILKTVNKIRETFEFPVLRTTIICGFPNETAEDVQINLDFMKTIKWDRLGGFTYSKEEDTPSYEMEETVSEEEKAKRLNDIMDLQEKIVQEKNKNLIGKELQVLVERQDGLLGFYHGRSVLSAPDGIDGEVIFKSDEAVKPGTFVSVKITKVRKHDLIGQLVK